MAFTLENAVVEFKASGLDSVIEASKRASQSASAIVAAAQQTSLSIGETSKSMSKLGADAAKAATGLERNATAFAVIHGVASNLASVLPLAGAELGRVANQTASFGSNRGDIAAIAAEMGKVKTQAEGIAKSLAKTGGGFGAMVANVVSGFGAMLTGNSLSKQTADLAAAAPGASAAVRPLAIDMGALRSNSTGAAKAMIPLVAVMNSIAAAAQSSRSGLAGMMKALSFSASAKGTKSFEAALGNIQPKAMQANAGLATLAPTVSHYAARVTMATSVTRDFSRSLLEMKSSASGRQLSQMADQMDRMAKQSGQMKRGGGFGLSGMMSGMSGGGGMASSLLGLAGIGSVGALGGGVLKLAADAETLKISFGTLLGSGKQAEAMVRNLQKLAAETPLSEIGVSVAAKRMLAYGFAAESIIPTLTTVGDAATSLAGGGAAGEEALTGIVRAMGQMRAKGKVQAEEMMQLAERGIPAWEMLADSMGVSVADAQKQVTAGTVSGQTGIDALTSGMDQRFGGGMKRMSQTTAGLFSTLVDSMRSVGRNIGDPFMPFAKSALKSAIAATTGLQAIVMPSIEVIRKALGKGFEFTLDSDTVTAAGEKLAGLTQTIVDAFSTAKQWVSSLSPEVLSMAGAFATSLPVISGLAGGFRMLSPLIAPIVSAVSMLGPVVGFLISPIGLVAAGVVGLGVALSRNKDVAKSFGDMASSAMNLVADAWTAAIEIGGELWGTAKELYAELENSDAWASVTSGVSTVISWIGRLMDDVGFMLRNWRDSWTIATESVRLMGANIGKVFGNLSVNIGRFVTSTAKGFANSWTALGVIGTEVFQQLSTNVGLILTPMATGIKKFFDAVRRGMSGEPISFSWLTEGIITETDAMKAAMADINRKSDFQWTGLTEGWQSSSETITEAIDRMAENEAKRLAKMNQKNKQSVEEKAATEIEIEKEKDKKKTQIRDQQDLKEKASKEKKTATLLAFDALAGRIADKKEKDKKDDGYITPKLKMTADEAIDDEMRQRDLRIRNAMHEAAQQGLQMPIENGFGQAEADFLKGYGQGVGGTDISNGRKVPMGRYRRAGSLESDVDRALQDGETNKKIEQKATEQANLLEKMTSLTGQLLQAATTTGLKIEPQVALLA